MTKDPKDENDFEHYFNACLRLRQENTNLQHVLAQKDNEIYELRQRMAGLDYKIEQLQDALDQGRVRDQSIIDEAIRASTKVKDEQIARLEKVIVGLREILARIEDERIHSLGGIGSPQ